MRETSRTRLLLVSACLAGCGASTAGDEAGGTGGGTDTTGGTTTPTSSAMTTDGSATDVTMTGVDTGDIDDSSGSAGTGTDTGNVDTGGLVGWASVSGEGVRTTTGGEGGRMVDVDTIEDLQMYAAADESYVIRISGTLDGIVEVSSNKTLEGQPGAVLNGGLVIEGPDGEWVQNVIVRDLTIVGDNCGGCTSTDGITVYRAHHVWIDHCDISDADDGNLDITEESDYVTVSWCRFSYSTTDHEHRFSNLIGAADEAVDDADDLKVTLHHNWWTENVAERMPRVRFGPVHVFNNYYTTVGELYCIRAGVEADVLVENNYFDGVGTPFDEPDPSATLVGLGNVFVPALIEEPAQGVAFDPPYEYSLDAADDVPAIVQAGAGPA